MKRLLFCAVLIILSALTSCDDMYNDAFSDNKSSIKYYGYVTTTSSLYSYEILEDGSFQQIGLPVTGLTSPQKIAVHPSGDYIYVAANGSILCYKTGDEGALTPLSPIVNSIVNYDMVIHPSGKYLYAIATSGSANPNIYIYSINPDGTLVFINTKARVGATSAAAIAINSSGSKLFLSCKVGLTFYVQTFVIGADGSLTVGLYKGFGVDVINMAVHPTSEYLYAVLNLNSVHVINYNKTVIATGELLDISNVGTLNTTDVKVNTSGKGIYISVLAAGQPSQSYGILNTGVLFKISDNNNLPSAALNTIEMHPNGKYVYFTDSNATYKSLICYTADSNGSLTFNSLTADCTPLNPFNLKIVSKTVFGESN